MNPEVRYQVFVSSTYEDLREERQQATQAILETGCFPSGMELFPASDETQWDLIKRIIEESDYYILIIAGRYGSVGPHGASYTEMEYDYDVEKGIPILGFVRDDISKITVNNSETSEFGREKLISFRQKAMSRTCRKYSSPAELGMAVMKSLMAEARVRPRTGWVRADQARSEDDAQRERKLGDDLKAAQERVKELERAIRDRALLFEEIPIESLAQEDDPVNISITFSEENKKIVNEIITLTYNEIFRIIGPTLYGYIMRNRNGYGHEESYPFQHNLEEHIRSKIVGRVQGRKINIERSQIDAIVIQFKELGLLMFQEKNEDGDKFRGVTLTELGERKLTLLSARRRKGAEPTLS